MVLNFASTKELLTKKYKFTIICNYVYWRCFLGVTSIKDIKWLGGGGVTHGWVDSEKKTFMGASTSKRGQKLQSRKHWKPSKEARNYKNFLVFHKWYWQFVWWIKVTQIFMINFRFEVTAYPF